MDNYIVDMNNETMEENPQFIYDKDDNYQSLTTDGEIKLILSEILHEPYLCKKIVKLKNQIEEDEAREYHSGMWTLVASEYFKGADRKQMCPHSIRMRDDTSYVLNLASNNTQYFVCKDIIRGYYNLTNISYQVRALLMTLIKEYTTDMLVGKISNEERLQWMVFDDKYYGILAKKIMDAMRE